MPALSSCMTNERTLDCRAVGLPSVLIDDRRALGTLTQTTGVRERTVAWPGALRFIDDRILFDRPTRRRHPRLKSIGRREIVCVESRPPPPAHQLLPQNLRFRERSRPPARAPYLSLLSVDDALPRKDMMGAPAVFWYGLTERITCHVLTASHPQSTIKSGATSRPRPPPF